MRVRLKPIDAYEVLDSSGRAVAVLLPADSWEGMTKLQAGDGQSLIIESPGALQEGMARALGSFGGELGVVECTVVRASPDLIPALLPIEVKA